MLWLSAHGERSQFTVLGKRYLHTTGFPQTQLSFLSTSYTDCFLHVHVSVFFLCSVGEEKEVISMISLSSCTEKTTWTQSLNDQLCSCQIFGSPWQGTQSNSTAHKKSSVLLRVILPWRMTKKRRILQQLWATPDTFLSLFFLTLQILLNCQLHR